MKGSRDSKLSKAKRSARGQVALPEDFRKRLTAYAATAGAACAGVFGLAQPARADIIVNNNPISIGVGSTVPFQINGVTEFTFVDFFTFRSGYRSHSTVGLLFVTPSMGHVLSNGSRQVSRLAKGAVIAPGGTFAKSAAVLQVEALGCGVQTCTPFASGQWGNKSGYFGFEFLSNGQTYFGWAHASVNISACCAISATISEFAYDTVANQSIQAGQTSATPEPGTLALLALGSLGLGFWRRKVVGGQQ